jgi:hypothetical protein
MKMAVMHILECEASVGDLPKAQAGAQEGAQEAQVRAQAEGGE